MRNTQSDKIKMRNLYQYRNMSDEDFDQIWEKKIVGAMPSSEFESRISRKLDEFAQDYDLSEMKVNDNASLRALIQAIIALEDYEQILFRMRSSGEDIGSADINIIDKISKIMSDLRGDIGRLQDDLQIKRKVRNQDKESSVINYIDSLKIKAKQFVESRSMLIVCDKCNMLLASLWCLYPEEDNKLVLHCHRKLENGEECGAKITISTKELMKTKGTNKIEVLPESLL
jgi:hypothetical protein